MQATTTASVTVTLQLTKKEADWLHAVMQNPVMGEHPLNESTEDSAMRLAFFNATETTI